MTGVSQRARQAYILIVAALNILIAIQILQTTGTNSSSSKDGGCQSPALQAAAAPPNSSPAAAAPAGNNTIKLFVGILSRARSSRVRQAIRDGYGSDPALVRVMFFVLRPESDRLFRAVREEAAQFRDVVVVSATREAYHNTTYSVLDIFRAAAMWSHSITHLLKTDEDCFVRVGKLVDRLAADGNGSWVYGGFPMTDQKDNIRVIRNATNKWYVPYSNWPSDDPVPPYAWGIGAVVSVDLVRHIAAGVAHVRAAPDNLLRIEDIAVGVWVDDVIREQRQQLTKVVMPIDQFRCVETEVISHLGWMESIKTDADLAAAHRCMHARGGACCTPPWQVLPHERNATNATNATNGK